MIQITSYVLPLLPTSVWLPVTLIFTVSLFSSCTIVSSPGINVVGTPLKVAVPPAVSGLPSYALVALSVTMLIHSAVICKSPLVKVAW